MTHSLTINRAGAGDPGFFHPGIGTGKRSVSDLPFLISPVSYTGTLGGVLTLVPATFGGPGVSQVNDWLVDYIPVSGSTLDTSLYPGSLIQARSVGTSIFGSVSSSTSPVTVPGSPGLTFTDNFTGSDNQLLTARGWTVSNSGDTTMNGLVVNGNRAFNSNFSHPTIVNHLTYDAGSSNHAIEFTWPTGLVANTPVFLRVGELDWNNHFAMQGISNTGGGAWQIGVSKKVAGVYTVLTNGYLLMPAPVAGDVWRLELKNNLIAFYVNGVQYSFGAFVGTPTGPRTGTTTADVSAAGFTPGTKVGFVPDNRQYADDVKVYNLTLPFSILSVSDNYPTTSGREINVQGAYTGAAPSGIDLGVLDASGATLIARRAATLLSATGGVWQARMYCPELMGVPYDNVTLPVQAWKAGSATNTGKGKSFVSQIYATIAPYRSGMNANVLSYFKPFNSASDLMYRAAWYNKPAGNKILTNPQSVGMFGANPMTANENCNLDMNGVLHSYWDGSTSQPLSTFAMPVMYLPQWINPAQKDYRLTGVPAGILVRNWSSGAGTLGPRQGPDSNGDYFYDYSFNLDSNGYTIGAAIPTLGFYGDIPPEGINSRFQMVPINWDSHFLTPAARTVYGNAKIARFMQGAFVSGDLLGKDQLTPSWIMQGKGNQFNLTMMTHQMMVAWCNDAGCDLWLSIRHSSSDEYLTAVITFIRDNLNPAHKLYLEYSNERWNNGPYDAENRFVQIEGMKLGYDNAGANAPAQCIPRPGTWVDGFGTGTMAATLSPYISTSGVAAITFYNGDYVYYSDGTGNAIVRRLTVGVAAGGTINNTNSTLIATTAFTAGVDCLTGPARTAGTYLFWVDSNKQYRCGVVSAAIAAGSKVIAGTNLTLLSGPVGLFTDTGSVLAGRRYGATREKQIFTLSDSIFGPDARARTVRVHADWLAKAGSVIGTNMLWDDLYTVCDGACVGAYFGSVLFNTYGNLTYAAQGFTLAAQETYANDPQTYANYAFTGTADGSGDINNGPMMTSMKLIQPSLLAQKHTLERTLRTKNDYVPNSVQLMSYECGFGEGWNNPATSGFHPISVTAAPATAGKGVLSNVSSFTGSPGGNYTVTLDTPTTFTVRKPDGTVDGTGTVGTQYTSSNISLKVYTGTVAFVAGDAFTVNKSAGAIGTAYMKPYMQRAISTVTKDPRMAILISSFYSFLRDQIGSAHCHFCDGEMDAVYNPSAYNCFGIIDYPADLTSARYVGWSSVQ